MESFDSPTVPMRYLALALELAEAQGVSRTALLNGLDLPGSLSRQLHAGTRPAPVQSRADLQQVVRGRLHAIGARLPGLEAMAEQLHMSGRSLKRHLQRQGTTYRRLLDEARDSASARLLREPGSTLDSVAEQLGYSSSANFSRAFRRWAGTTPGARRAALRSGI